METEKYNSKEWKLADAKNKFSELFTLTQNQGPQWIRRRKDRAVLISQEAYQRLSGEKLGLKKHLLQGESFEGLSLPRDTDLPRDIKW